MLATMTDSQRDRWSVKRFHHNGGSRPISTSRSDQALSNPSPRRLPSGLPKHAAKIFTTKPRTVSEVPISGQRYAILLANCHDLPSALTDTVQLAKMLVSKGYPTNRILPVIIDPPKDRRWHQADYPTGVIPYRVVGKDELWSLLGRIYTMLFGNGAVDLLFTVSSHGGTGLPNPKEADGYDEYITVDGVVVRDDELKQQVVDRLPSNVRLTLIVDTCSSGTMFDLPQVWSETAKDSRVVCVSACCDNQYAYDAVGSRFGHVGGLVNVTLEHLERSKDGTIMVSGLVAEAQKKFSRLQTVTVTMM